MNPIGFILEVPTELPDAQKAAQKDDRANARQSGKSLISRTSTALPGKGKVIVPRPDICRSVADLHAGHCATTRGENNENSCNRGVFQRAERRISKPERGTGTVSGENRTQGFMEQ